MTSVILLAARSLLILAALAGPAAAQLVLNGAYDGMGAASGNRIEIAPDPGGFTGSYRERQTGAQPFEADRRGDQAETVITRNGRAHLMQISPLPYGAEVALIPFNEDGTLALDGAAVHTYLREGLSVPQAPEGYLEAPRDTRTQITANSFLASYEFWRPVGVRNGYLSLPSRARTLIRLFPAVQLDVIWKLCLAPKADQALAIALKGQGVRCDGVVSGIAAAQSQGRFDAYKAEVASAKGDLVTAIKCGEGYLMTRADCERAGRRVSEAAISLETAATVLARHR